MPRSVWSVALLSIALANPTRAALASPQGRVWMVDDSGVDYGAAFRLDLRPDLGMNSQSEFHVSGSFHDFTHFGSAATSLGDLDGDGVVDLAVGAPGSALEPSSVRVLFLETNGSVQQIRVIRPGDADFDVVEGLDQGFGAALANLGDLDGNGVADLAVGAPEGVTAVGTGHVWILFLESDASVASFVRIDASHGGFTGLLDDKDEFGGALASLGDLDGDGLPELAVGAPGDDDGGVNSGALWILHLDANGSVKSSRKISRTSGGLTGTANNDRFGSSITPVGDVDHDGVLDLALGAPFSDTGGNDVGVVWILFLNADETVRAQHQLTRAQLGLVAGATRIGTSSAPLGDIDGDGTSDLAVGVPGGQEGRVVLLRLQTDGTVLQASTIGKEQVLLRPGDGFGTSLANLGDLDADGNTDLVVGAARRTTFAGTSGLPTAIAASSNGDVILVRSGSYEGFDLGAKSLTLQAERDGVVDVDSSSIHDLTAGQKVLVRGLRLGLLTLHADAGLVWIEACEVPTEIRNDEPGLKIDGCADVVLLASSFSGQGHYILAPTISAVAGHGLQITGGSSVQAYDCTFRGADAGLYSIPSFPSVAPQRGGSGVNSAAAGDFVFLAGCEARGGSGTAYSQSPLSTDCTSGGAGLRVVGHAVVLDSEFFGGPGGLDAGVPCAPDGPDRTGSVHVDPGTATSLSIPSPVHEGETFTLVADGPPNAMVFLQTGANPTAVFRAPLSGSALVRPPIAVEYLGNTNGAGRLVVQRTTGELPPSFAVGKAFFQVFYVGTSGPPTATHVRATTKVLGAGSMVIVLDESL